MKIFLTEELGKLKENVKKKMNDIESTNMMLQQHITSQKRSNEDLIRKCE